MCVDTSSSTPCAGGEGGMGGRQGGKSELLLLASVRPYGAAKCVLETMAIRHVTSLYMLHLPAHSPLDLLAHHELLRQPLPPISGRNGDRSHVSMPVLARALGLAENWFTRMG